jgi:ABC-type sugar transport system ATPase subunit
MGQLVGDAWWQSMQALSPLANKLVLRKKVGIVFQQYNLFPHKTASQLGNIAVVLALHVLGGFHDQRLVEDQAPEEAAGRQPGLLVGATDLRRVDPGEPEPLAADPDRKAEINSAVTVSPSYTSMMTAL